jgi:hypothetical protein
MTTGEKQKTVRSEEAGLDALSRQFLPGVYRAAAIVGLLGLIGLSAFASGDMAANFGIGTLLGMGMVYSTEHIVRRYLVPTDNLKRGRRRLMALMLAKLPVLGVVLFFVTRSAWHHPIGLVLGLGVMPGMLTVCGIFRFWSMIGVKNG